jgi:hypothetical protein
MLFIIGALIALAVLSLIARARFTGMNDANLGQMSEQWLAEYRASHPM